jgi:outer membrane protein assembly factor BamD (BamD/ComL family)
MQLLKSKSNDAWQKVKDSHNVGDFENFVQEFPNSSFSNTAKMRMHELKAVEYYNAGDYANAYSEFGNAGGGYAIDASNKGLL